MQIAAVLWNQNYVFGLQFRFRFRLWKKFRFRFRLHIWIKAIFITVFLKLFLKIKSCLFKVRSRIFAQKVAISLVEFFTFVIPFYVGSGSGMHSGSGSGSTKAKNSGCSCSGSTTLIAGSKTAVDSRKRDSCKEPEK
jgi:hypothetical protein